jgi:predicted ABC-type ATPase
MSSSDKIELLKLAKELGYRNYLYFIATSDPLINISRVKYRVFNGGHNVTQEKIISRYYRTLENLKDAVKLTNRAYIFDNSSHKKSFICEITNGKNIEFQHDNIPLWINQYLLGDIKK